MVWNSNSSVVTSRTDPWAQIRINKFQDWATCASINTWIWAGLSKQSNQWAVSTIGKTYKVRNRKITTPLLLLKLMKARVNWAYRPLSEWTTTHFSFNNTNSTVSEMSVARSIWCNVSSANLKTESKSSPLLKVSIVVMTKRNSWLSTN